MLKRYVRFFWTLEADVAAGGKYVHRALADSCSEWIFHYQGTFEEILGKGATQRSFTSGFQGPTSSYRRFEINRGFGIFGVYLYPFAVPALFDVSAEDLRNQMPDIASLLGLEGLLLEEKIMLAPNNNARVSIVSDFLLKRLSAVQNPPNAMESAVKSIIVQRGAVSVEALASDYCLSKRHFERKFRTLTGFSPKLYSRIARFQSVFPELLTPTASLTDVAFKCGYYDQSHFIQEFREFSGFSPGEFLKGGSSETTNWTS